MPNDADYNAWIQQTGGNWGWWAPWAKAAEGIPMYIVPPNSHSVDRGHGETDTVDANGNHIDIVNPAWRAAIDAARAKYPGGMPGAPSTAPGYDASASGAHPQGESAATAPSLPAASAAPVAAPGSAPAPSAIAPSATASSVPSLATPAAQQISKALGTMPSGGVGYGIDIVANALGLGQDRLKKARQQRMGLV